MKTVKTEGKDIYSALKYNDVYPDDKTIDLRLACPLDKEAIVG